MYCSGAAIKRDKSIKKTVALHMTLQAAYRQLLAQLYEIYDKREAANIADWVIEHVTGQRKIERIVYKDLPVFEQQQQTLQTITNELLQHKPVQYVLHEAWFYNMKLYVNENVLIPRPETEELVELIVEKTIEDSKLQGQSTVLDIGTGSGCIAIALKKKMGNLKVFAIDISANALGVAQQNATQQNVEINYMQVDFLDKSKWEELPAFDIIVSNPPYIRKSEDRLMAPNVLKYEPHVALFVPDEDALKFYKAIADFAKMHLQLNGSVYVEINEGLAAQVITVFEQANFKKVRAKKDLQGKDRIVIATSLSYL
jgi:release factor glutamine methyltransferase